MPANVVAGLQINIIGDVGPFAQAMDRAEQIAKKQSRAIQQAINKEMQESKHSLALFGEAFGVGIPRHIRGFISELPGVSKAMSAAFSGLAILVVVKTIEEAVKKVQEFREALQKAQESPKKITEAFEGVYKPLQRSNDELALANDKIAASIAKLEHKPVNNVAVALDEARVFADKLGDSIEKDIQAMNKLLGEQKVGFWGKVLNQNDNAWVGTQEANNNSELKRIEDEGNESVHKATTKKGADDATSDMRTKLDGAYGRYIANLDRELSEAKTKQEAYLKVKNWVGPIPKDMSTDVKDQSALIATLEGARRQRVAERDSTNLQYRNNTLTETKGGLDASNAAGQGKVKGWEEELANTREQYALHGYEMTKADEADFWLARLNLVQKGSDAYNAVNKKASAGVIEALKLADAEQEKFAKFGREYTTNNTGVQPYLDGLHSINKATEDWFKESAKSVEINEKNADSLAEANIRYNESLGVITKLGAAQQMATLHATEHQHVIEKLNNDLQSLKNLTAISDVERKARQQKIQNEIDTENGRYGVTRINDAGALQAQMTGMMSSFNAQFTNAMTGKKTDFGSVFSNAGSGMINKGLGHIESGIFSKLGFGKLGTRANPMITQDVNSAGTVASLAGGLGGKLGGFLGKIGSFFGGFFADGGSPDPYKASIVGERGPELFVPRGVSGQVISNNQLSRSLGAGGHVTYNIDATGTNAAEVDMRVKQGMIMAHNQAVQSTQMAMQERQRRVPSSKRGA